MSVRRSITLRLTLLFALASSTVLLAVGSLIGIVVEQHFEEQDLAELSGKLELTRHALGKLQHKQDLEQLALQLDNALIGHPGLSVMVLNQDNKIIFISSGAVFPMLVQQKKNISVTGQPLQPLSWQRGDQTYAGIATAVTTSLPDKPTFTVAIALDVEHRQQFMLVFQETLWILFIVGIALSALLGWIAAHQGLSPVRHIALVAKGISADQLNDRLPLDTVPTELRDLAQSFNGMLSRLEGSFQRLSNFSSDLAHELRAPVSNLMTQTQVALSKSRSTDEYKDILASNLEEYDRLARMVSDMLFLAKADHGQMVTQQAPVDVLNEIQQLIEFYEPLSDESSVTMHVDGSATILGDKLMIRRALSNLLSNALRHTRAGGQISVNLSENASGEASISIENPGEDIAAEHIDHLFDRFYRVDPARPHSGEGVGLGLAITKSIIEGHQGTINVSSNKQLTRFLITLPVAQQRIKGVGVI